MNYLDTNTIYNMDCVLGMSIMEPKSVDLVITDPPFGIGFGAKTGSYNRDSSLVLEGYNEIDQRSYLTFTFDWLSNVHKVLKDSGSVFIFSGYNNLKDILTMIDNLHFTLINHLIWKYQFGVVCKRKFVTSHYHCLFVCKDDKKRQFYNCCRFQQDDASETGGSARYKDMEDVWTINREYWAGDEKTPTKLPREVVDKLLAYTSQPGDLVLDPFLGSGQVAVVSKLAGRRFIGFEIVPAYWEFAQRRLDANTYRL